MVTAYHIPDSRAFSRVAIGARDKESKQMEYVLFHVPSGMFADQHTIEADGTIRTCGFAYTSLADALDDIARMGDIGGNPDDWIAIAKPDSVVTDWIV